MTIFEQKNHLENFFGTFFRNFLKTQLKKNWTFIVIRLIRFWKLDEHPKPIESDGLINLGLCHLNKNMCIV